MTTSKAVVEVSFIPNCSPQLWSTAVAVLNYISRKVRDSIGDPSTVLASGVAIRMHAKQILRGLQTPQNLGTARVSAKLLISQLGT